MVLRRLADASHRVIFLFTMSNSAVFFVPARVAAPGFFLVSLAFSPWDGLSDSDTHRRPSRDRVRWVSRTALNPSYEFSYLPFLSRDIRARVLLPFLPSQLPIPDRGDGGAPGGGILYPVARVIARRHVCEAWAVPRNRNGATRRSTVTVLGPLRAGLRSCLRLVCAVPSLPGTVYEPRPGRHL